MAGESADVSGSPVPKISAPTVAEHHAHRRAALINAAIEILVEHGVAGVTPATVGARAGLARSSVYQYFPSTAALLATIVEEAFPRANSVIQAALDTAGTPRERVDAYIRQTLVLASEGVHRPAAALLAADLPAECRARLAELHAQQAAPLFDALSRLGLRDPSMTARLVGGVLQAAMAAIEQGSPVEHTIGEVLAFVKAGLDSGRRVAGPGRAGRAARVAVAE
jgi:AcrR family transcriptional regulator